MLRVLLVALSFRPAIAALFLLLTPPLGAQQNPPATVQKFVARTELVTVPVIVLSHRKHVTGLHKADFEIEEDGHPMTLATFEEVGLAQSAKPIPPPPGIYTNEVLADGPVTMTIIALDLINTPYPYQEPVKRELLEYLQHSYRADRPAMLAILSRSGLRVIHDFTNDPQVLETLVRHLKRDVKHDLESDAVVQKDDSGTLLQQIDVSAEYEALEKEFFGDPSVTQGNDSFDKFIADNDREATLLELRQLARGLSSVPGMKSLIWVSGGIVLPRIMDTRSLHLVDEYEETWKLLNAATMVVTPIDTVLESSNAAFRDTMHMLPDPNRSIHLSLTPEIQRIQNFWDLAQRTGGDYCLMRRDRDCFQKMSHLTSHYYLLTYYTKPSDRSQWRKIRVKVRGENLKHETDTTR
jgi:VWFA-related protein